jgi:heme exporter protein A
MQKPAILAGDGPQTGLVPETVLRVSNLQYRIGLTSILKNIQLVLRQGEVLALLGPNGAGKSTLLKCLAGLVPHTGSKELFGTVDRHDQEVKRRIGYLGHESFLYMKLSATENLLFYAGLYGKGIDPGAMLADFHLAAARDQLVETFSRGMKQRLSLARALLPDPQLLLLDEPFTGLDQQAGELLEAKIRDLKGRITLILTTHELERAYEMADRFLILRNGRQTFFGPREEITGGIRDFYREKTVP